MLLSLILIPLLGATVISLSNVDTTTGLHSMKRLALICSFITFIISLFVWSGFDSNYSGYQFSQEFNQAKACHLFIGVDGLSLYFVLLTTFITPISLLSNWSNIYNIHSLKLLFICFLLLESFLITVFLVADLLLFYIFFESVLIPLFITVVLNSKKDSEPRVRAGMMLFLYTLFGSLFMLLSILYLYYQVGSTSFDVLNMYEISLDYQKWIWLGFFLSLAIKTPLWPLHIWLQKAHAEAPVGGSVALAALVLKLATYGYLRILIQLLPDASYYYSPLVQSIAVITIIYASLSTLRQTDIKQLVALSSVAHMGVGTLAIFSNTIQGIEGAIILGISHGFVSPALFILVGAVLYDRSHTRTIKYYRGLTLTMPVFSIYFFLFTIFNAGVPLSLNWVGEILGLSGAFEQNPILASLGASGIVLSAAYSIYVYNRVSFGSYSKHLGPMTDMNRREVMLLTSLLIPTVWFGLAPNIILNDLHLTVSNLIYSV